MFQKIYLKLQTREGITLVASLALIVLTLAVVFGDMGRPHKSDPFGQPQPSISITGTGEVVTVPDIARFAATISHDAKTMSEAQQLVTQQSNSLVESLKLAGIEEKDIKTDSFNAYPKYETKTTVCGPTYCPPSYGNPVVVGYTVSHTYEIKVRNLDNVGDIAKILTDANISTINGPSFGVDDMQVIKQQAQKEAIDNAREQARVLANQLGVRLGKIVDFQVVGDGYVYPMMSARVESASYDGAGQSPAPSITPGETKVSAQVVVTYRIK